MIKPIVIQNITSTPEWRTIFQYVLSYCNEFAVTFPDGKYDVENPLMGGKDQFECLSDFEIKKSPAMDEGWVISGKLTNISTALFEVFMAPSNEGFKPVLWNFQLLKDSEPILEISDFTVCLLYHTAPIKQFLKTANINIKTLQN